MHNYLGCILCGRDVWEPMNKAQTLLEIQQERPCPNCNNPIEISEVLDEGRDYVMTCPHCGSVFHVSNPEDSES